MTDWVRLWHDMPTDPKWRVIAKRAGRAIAEVVAVFNFVLVNASANASERGRTHNLFADDIAAALDMETEQIEAILAAMQGKVLDGERLSAWEKRQPKREDSSAERAKQWRERKRTQANASERPETETETEEDAETERKKERGGAGAPADVGFAFVGKVVRLKADQLSQWRTSYHAIPDIMAEINLADDYYHENPPPNGSWFFPVSRWLQKEHEAALAARRTPLDIAEEKALRGAI